MRCRLALAKVPLCLLIGCSTLFGYILADPVVTQRTLLTGFGIFVLATGAASLNSMQEYRLDGEFERTRRRPIPQGLLTPRQAGIQALILLLAGLMILYITTATPLPVLTAGLAVILYNGVYTPLKRKTVIAIVPGAICGALPAYIGWLSGGGGGVSYTGLLLIVLFVLWQVPHFWLVLLSFKEEYQRSSLPNLLKHFREDQLKRLFVTWIGALVSVMLLFLTLPFSLGWPTCTGIIVNACLLFIVFTCGLAGSKATNYRSLFIVLNIALFLHMVILSAGRMLA